MRAEEFELQDPYPVSYVRRGLISPGGVRYSARADKPLGLPDFPRHHATATAAERYLF